MRLTFDELVGKTILVGVTYLDNTGTEIQKTQFFGTIINADEYKGILIKKANTDEEFFLPSQINAIRVASPGEYRLHSTGEVIINPDLLTAWAIMKP